MLFDISGSEVYCTYSSRLLMVAMCLFPTVFNVYFLKFTLRPNLSHPPSFLPNPTLTNLSLHLPLALSSEKESPSGYHPSLGHLVPAGLGTSTTQAQPGSPSRSQSNGREQRRRQPPLHFLGDPHEHQAHICHKCVGEGGCLGPPPTCFLVGDPGSLNLHVPN